MSDYGTVARPYAKALFDIARDSGSLDGWSQGLAAAAAVASDDRARAFLARPEQSAGHRAEFVWSICGDVEGADILRSQEGRNLLRVLAENDRLAALPEISAQFDHLKAEAERKVKVTLVAAEEVDAERSQKVREALERRLGRSVDLELAVDRNLLGGAILKAEDRVIDGSVRSRLARLADALVD